MTNQAAAGLIATHLRTGLPHPGNNNNPDQPPTLIPLPGFRTTGLPPAYADAVNNAATHIGEAIIHLLETNGYTLTEKADTVMAPTTSISGVDYTVISCVHCHQMLAAISANNQVEPATFITQVGGLNPDCASGHTGVT